MSPVHRRAQRRGRPASTASPKGRQRGEKSVGATPPQSDRGVTRPIIAVMSFDPAFLDFAQRQGDRLIARVISRDHLQLAPATLSKAAAARLRQGLRALEAYLRRLLLCLALQLEPALQLKAIAPSRRPRERQPNLTPRFVFRIFTGEQDCPDLSEAADPWGERFIAPGRIEAAPLLTRLSALKTLLEAPTKRARRLAFHIARHRPGPMLAPDRQAHVPRRFGTELSASYDAMASLIPQLSHARPPPLFKTALTPFGRRG